MIAVIGLLSVLGMWHMSVATELPASNRSRSVSFEGTAIEQAPPNGLSLIDSSRGGLQAARKTPPSPDEAKKATPSPTPTPDGTPHTRRTPLPG